MYYIYRITNKINGKTYIGQHKYKKLNDKYMGSGVYLAKAKKKYGMENFEKEILYSRIQYKETADDMEKFAINKERALGKAEYNIADGGQGSCCTPSEETKKKISEANKGRKPWNKGKKMPEDLIKKNSESHKGQTPWNKGKTGVYSIETKRRMSEMARNRTDEHKRKLSESHKGQVPWNKGKTGVYSEEALNKMSDARKGKLHTEEWKKKHSDAMKGENNPFYGKHHSDETKKKLSEMARNRTEEHLAKDNINVIRMNNDL